MNNETKPKVGQSTTVLTGTFRVSFPAVFAPKKANPNDTDDKAKYSLHMLYPVTDPLTALRAACRIAATEKWGPQDKWPKNLQLPFRKGEEKDYDGYGKGIIFVSASSKQKPGLVDENVQPIITADEFYGGCYARATVNAFAWEYMGKAGISFGLRNIQKVKDGEPFGGKSKPENDFDSIPMAEGGAAAGASAGAAGEPDLGI